MAIERRVVIGWSDIQAIVFSCTSDKCGARITVLPTADPKDTIPEGCPRGHSWGPRPQGSAVARVLRTLGELMREQMGFTVLLQLDEAAIGSPTQSVAKK
jgi:hypothetical protein